MSATPLVSIITPTRNQAGYLEAAMRSVAGQTYRTIEHIVIDGASDDRTQAILRLAERDGVRWISEPDSGMYDAVNKGLMLSKGEVLGYLNSDDAYMPWAVEVAVAALERHPDTDIVFGDAMRVDEITGRQRLRFFPPFDRRSLAAFESIAQPAVFWRRRLVERIGGFDASLRFVGDLDYWLRAATVGPAPLHIADVLAVERVHRGALSVASQAAMAAEDRAMRDGHTDTGAVTPNERARAVRRNKVWQRRAWLRFAAASLRGSRDPRWLRFRTDGALFVQWWRAAAGQLPRGGDRFLPGAVRSALADRLLDGAA